MTKKFAISFSLLYISFLTSNLLQKHSSHTQGKELRLINSRFSLSLLLITVSFGMLFFFAEWDSIISNPAASKKVKMPSRGELIQHLRNSPRIIIVYPSETPDLEGKYRRKIADLSKRNWWFKFEALPVDSVTTSVLRGNHIYLLGTVGSNPLFKQLEKKLPLKINPKGFEIVETPFQEPSDVLTLFYPNPWSPQYALFATLANDDHYLLSALEDEIAVFKRVGDYRVRRGRDTLIMGFFNQTPEGRWEIDPQRHRNFAAETRTIAKSPHYELIFHRNPLSKSEAMLLLEKLERRLASLKTFLGIERLPRKIRYHVYETLEDKGLMTGNTALSHSRLKAWEVHTAVEPDLRGDDFLEDARLIVRDVLGKPVSEIMEMGLAMTFTSNWRGKGYEYWAVRLHLSGNDLPLEEMFDHQGWSQCSELIARPLAGTFVAYLRSIWGRNNFLTRYKQFQPTKDELRELESGWHNFLDSLATHYEEQIVRDRSQVSSLPDFQKGFCFAHEGYSIYNGYLSRKADEALEKLSSLGSNAISITPFTYMRDPHTPTKFRFSHSAGEENDESVIHAILKARRLGMITMLKPHIWLHRAWPGEIEMKSEAEWKQFFEFYQRWISHYALLAEMYQVDILSLGVEMSRTTLSHPEEWRKLIRTVRKLYSGKITYSANWGEEFENVSFWDALDYIGVNCYYPLSTKDNPTDTELQDGVKAIARRIEAVHRRFQKPVIITEIGFTATPMPWKEPHADARGKGLDPHAQARCYEAVLTVLHEQPWLKGLYWWKWPSYLEYGGLNDNDFTPNNKPAEEIVKKWFQRW
ncbi:MAG: hypothetical protein D6748_03635 [Calditrichaeota bacterium]|nr:MAG: hypothetical protein D6748_03635 [Calditrichota bacterium]